MEKTVDEVLSRKGQEMKGDENSPKMKPPKNKINSEDISSKADQEKADREDVNVIPDIDFTEDGELDSNLDEILSGYESGNEKGEKEEYDASKNESQRKKGRRRKKKTVSDLQEEMLNGWILLQITDLVFSYAISFALLRFAGKRVEVYELQLKESEKQELLPIADLLAAKYAQTETSPEALFLITLGSIYAGKIINHS